MSTEVCFAYRWATYGGVERVFLNRALAFERAGVDVCIDVHYGADGGGLAPFRRAIAELGLAHRIRVVERIDPARYPAVFVIDSPELVMPRDASGTRWIMECHTPYVANRAYLDALPAEVDCVVAPSRTFLSTLAAERPALAPRLKLLRNCVAACASGEPVLLPAWPESPLLYFGRFDELKNPQGLLDLIRAYDELGRGRGPAVLLGPEQGGYELDARIDRAGLRGRAVRLPPLDFLRTGAFLDAFRRARGVMVSPSWGESFGLAAAESIAAGVPVLLSALPEHAELVDGDERHLYRLDRLDEAVDRLVALLDDYDAASVRMRRLAARFDDDAFLDDWRLLLPQSAPAC